MSESDASRPRLSTIVMIYVREMRDQLRDRRTIFTIAVLPLVLYPLVGMLLLQIAQFSHQHTPSLCVIGEENLPGQPPFIHEGQFAEGLAEVSGNARLTTLAWDQVALEGSVPGQAQSFVDNGKYDAVLLIPPGFRLHRGISEPNRQAAAAADQEAVPHQNDAARNSKAGPQPRPLDAHKLRLFVTHASDQSRVAGDRIYEVLTHWRNEVIHDTLQTQGVDQSVLQPFEVEQAKVRRVANDGAIMWSKLLPFVMLVWAMTGAFYPAIDLVAGEKERGTLETLLCSPALRSEIVWGKLAAVTTFSTMTALLNVGSMLMTGSFVLQQVAVGSGGAMGPPPVVSMLWLLVALLPLATLFSALALAVAALARSSKEGQYYLMPLMMVTLPLVLLPMMPGTSFHTGTALIPVTGMFLLVRALVEGNYGLALLNLPVVVGVTIGCLWLATRWAQRQFEDESVLFGGNDQWELRSWVRHLWRDRQVVPTPAQAFACGAVILVGLFFGKLMVREIPTDMGRFTIMLLVPQVGLILAPAALMATVLTTSLKQSFRVRMPSLGALPVAFLLGLTLHPSYITLGQWISETYPISEQARMALAPMSELIASASWLHVIFLLALVPAICEELAFRGFIFSGLVRSGGQMRAIVVTAAMFGISHGMLQQSLAASVMGVLLGWVALRTGSVLPGLVIHFTNNALSLSLDRIATLDLPGSEFFIRTAAESGVIYQPIWTLMASGLAVTCVLYFSVTQNADQEEACELLLMEPAAGDPRLTPVA